MILSGSVFERALPTTLLLQPPKSGHYLPTLYSLLIIRLKNSFVSFCREYSSIIVYCDVMKADQT